MKNLFLWYIPQTLLFGVGVWVGLNEPNVRMPVIIGLTLASIYTAGVMVVRDAPAHFRGIEVWGRRFFSVFLSAMLLGSTGVIVFAVGRGSGFSLPVFGGVALFGIAFLVWAMALGLWHSFTVKPRSISRLDSRSALQRDIGESHRDRVGRTGTWGGSAERPKHVDRLGISE